MRPLSLVLGGALIAAAGAVWLISGGSNVGQQSGPVESGTNDYTPAEGTEIDSRVRESAVSTDDHSQIEEEVERDQVQLQSNEIDRARLVEQASLELAHEHASEYVNTVYAQLLRHLQLESSEQDLLISMLVEDRALSASTPESVGIDTDMASRSERIATIIGEDKLQEFLALEENLESYATVYATGATLASRGLPVSESQQDALLNVFVRMQNSDVLIPSDVPEKGSIRYLEYRLAQIDERDRLIIEQAGSVLSPDQVQYLFERYQRDSYRRAEALEAQKRAKADNPEDDLPLWYPARTE